jgi:hypothetical protein
MSGIELLLSDRRGVYIPRDFAEIIASETRWTGIESSDIEFLLNGPDQEGYWDTWDSVLGSAKYTDPEGNEWRLNQDGDLWLYCEQLMTDEEYEGFFGEARERFNDLDADSRFETDNWYDTSAELK